MKHGFAKSSTYSSWSNVVQRCNNITTTVEKRG